MSITFSTSPWKPHPYPISKPTLAVGDLHGREDLLEAFQFYYNHCLRPSIAHHHPLVIYLGDLIGKGPHSYKTLSRALYTPLISTQHHVLPGNHEHMLWVLLNTDLTHPYYQKWVATSGRSLLKECGLLPTVSFKTAKPVLHARFYHLLKRFNTPMVYQDQAWHFVHAGLPLTEAFSVWEPYLPLHRAVHPLWMKTSSWDGCPSEKMVVHGHTPKPFIEHTHDRICLDTKAYKTGRLSVAEIHQHRLRFHTIQGPALATQPPPLENFWPNWILRARSAFFSKGS